MQRTLLREAEGVLVFNAAEIEAARASKQVQADELQRLEGSRVALVARICARSPGSPPASSLGALLERLAPPEAARLRPLHTRLRELLPRVQAANRGNQALLTQALEVVHGSLSLLGHGGAEAAVYRRSGALERGRNAGALLSGAL
jgi:hypothetical protein